MLCSMTNSNSVVLEEETQRRLQKKKGGGGGGGGTLLHGCSPCVEHLTLTLGYHPHTVN